MEFVKYNIFKILTILLTVAVAVQFYQIHYLTVAYDSEIPAVVMDWNDIANPENYAGGVASAEAAIQAARQAAADLAAAGYIVIDGRAVTQAYPDAVIGSAQIKQRMQARP